MANGKSAIFAFALASLLAFSAFSGCINGNSSKNAGIEDRTVLISAQVLAGRVCYFAVHSELENTSLLLPPGLLVMDNNVISINSTIEFSGSSFDFLALVPPGISDINITATDGAYSKKFSFNSSGVSEQSKFEEYGCCSAYSGIDSTSVVSGKKIFDMVKYISQNYPLRLHGTPNWLLFQIYIVQTLQSYGLEVHTTPADGASAGEFPLNIVAYHWGADRNNWIGMGAHTDTTFMEPVIEGAYDNAAGVSTVLELARVLSQYKFDKTIMFGFWGAEEEGDIGSMYYAQTMPAGVKMDYYVNFDMVGLNWPGPKDNPTPFRMFVRHNDAAVEKQTINFAKYIVHEACRYPRGNNTFKIVKDTMGSSDHVSFADVGVPAFKCFGAKEDYPYYHTIDDSFANMVAFMGDEETLMKGFAVPAWIGFYITIYAEENFPAPAAFSPEEI